MYTIYGKVIKGAQRGRDLGFPTANVLIDQEIPQGIYISRMTIDDRIFPSVTFIGNATTFGESDVKSETYILDFNQDMYDKMVAIELREFIRGNEKFESVEKLVIQMNEDIEKARNYFKTHNA